MGHLEDRRPRRGRPSFRSVTDYVAQALRTGFHGAVHVVENLRKHDAFVASSAIAFDAFLSLIPILALIGYVLHRTHERGGLLVEPLLRTAPKPIAELAGAEFLRVSDDSAATLAPLSALGFLWLASAGVSTAMSVFERMFAAPPRSWLRRRAAALLAVLFTMSIVAIAGTVLVGIVEILGSTALAVFGVLFPPLFVIASLAAFYRLAVRRPSNVRRRSLPGAMLTVFLWTLLSAGFSSYVASFGRFSTFYGSLAAVAISMLWLWLLAVALLAGGELNAILEGVREKRF